MGYRGALERFNQERRRAPHRSVTEEKIEAMRKQIYGCVGGKNKVFKIGLTTSEGRDAQYRSLGFDGFEFINIFFRSREAALDAEEMLTYRCNYQNSVYNRQHVNFKRGGGLPRNANTFRLYVAWYNEE